MKPEIILKEHNIESYSNVREMFKTKNKAAVIQPPGTGKSFIALKWIEENKDKKTLFLVPTFLLYIQLEQHLKTCGYSLKDFPNLQVMTYAKLMEEAKNNNVPKIDQIVLDEFHRCGAPEWGKGVQKLLEENPESKVLGLSATPIRYLDQNRDMSDEIFDGNVASTMDLTEAVARGILKMPLHYITSIYELEDDIKRLENETGKVKDVEDRKEIEIIIEQAKRHLEKASGIDDIIEKYITKKDSKIVVFCKDKNHLQEMKLQHKKWFSKVNQDIDTYSVYYDKPRKETELHNFYTNQSNHLKVLYCIDIFNEGFHTDVDVLMMLRPTISPILFTQQLGRGLSTGKRDTIVFDLVNNIRSSQDMRNFRDKVEQKARVLLKEGKIKELPDLGHFQIVEEMLEIVTILEHVENMLQSKTSKEAKIRMVEEFYRLNGRLPKRNEQSPEGENIGAFLSHIKQGNTKITEDQLQRLEALGFTMEIKDVRQSIEMKIKMVEEFYRLNGRLPKWNEQSPEGENIGAFLSQIKQGNTKITEDQLQRLEALGFTMEIKDVRQSIEMKIKMVEEFYRLNGRLPKQKEKSPEGENIGRFLDRIKQGTTKITEDQLQRLEALGFTMEIKINIGKEAKIRMVEEFYRLNGRLPKQNEQSPEGEKIGAFLSQIKQGNTKITEDQLQRLEALGFTTEIKINIGKEEKIKLIEEFYQEHGRLPKWNEQSPEGENIGSFLRSIKQGTTKITEDQLQRLEALGFTTEIKDVRQSIEIKIKMIEEFYRVNGRLPKWNEKSPEGENIGRFLSNIKQGTTKITEEQLQRLEALGFTKEIKDVRQSIEMKIKMVEEFYRLNGRLPKQNEQSPEGENIGSFLDRIKQGTTKITEDQLQKLEALGFTMKIKDVRQSIEMKIKMVEEIYRLNGRLPKWNEQSPTGENIGSFLKSIKQGTTKITEDQLKRLEALGFTMEIKDVRQSIEMKIKMIEEFYRLNGRLPKFKEQSPEGENIGRFLDNIKQRKTKITEEQKQRLERIGVDCSNVVTIKSSHNEEIEALNQLKESLLERTLENKVINRK